MFRCGRCGRPYETTRAVKCSEAAPGYRSPPSDPLSPSIPSDLPRVYFILGDFLLFALRSAFPRTTVECFVNVFGLANGVIV